MLTIQTQNVYAHWTTIMLTIKKYMTLSVLLPRLKLRSSTLKTNWKLSTLIVNERHNNKQYYIIKVMKLQSLKV